MKPTIATLSAIAFASLLAACGGSSSDTPTATVAPGTSAPVPTAVPTAVPTSAAATPTPVPPAGGLTGVWSGKYNGIYTGTFTLTWQQSGTGVSGTIVLSSPPKTSASPGTRQVRLSPSARLAGSPIRGRSPATA